MVLVALRMAVARTYVSPRRRDRDVPAGLRQHLSLGLNVLLQVSVLIYNYYVNLQETTVLHNTTIGIILFFIFQVCILCLIVCVHGCGFVHSCARECACAWTVKYLIPSNACRLIKIPLKYDLVCENTSTYMQTLMLHTLNMCIGTANTDKQQYVELTINNPSLWISWAVARGVDLFWFRN